MGGEGTTIWACALTVIGALIVLLLGWLCVNISTVKKELRAEITELKKDLQSIMGCMKGKLPTSLFYNHWHDEHGNVVIARRNGDG